MKAITKLALAAAFVLVPTLASAQETVQVGVFLPQANFADNSARGVYADAVAGAMTKASGGAITFRGTAFAKLSDLGSFLKANKIDILLADGVWIASRGGKIIAHAVDGSGKASRPAALYGGSGATVLSLKGKTIAVTDVGSKNVAFYTNTALEGELDPKSYFGKVTARKDVYAALGAVKAAQAGAAFAPLGHPAATGLKVLAKGGDVPLALAIVINDKLSEAATKAASQALGGGAGKGGGIGGWRSGAGPAYKSAAGAAKRAPKVNTGMPILTATDHKSARPPRVKLTATGELPPPSVANATIYPTLSE